MQPRPWAPRGTRRAGLPILEQYEISEQDAMEDFMMVGLRLLRGVKNSDFAKQFDRELDAAKRATLISNILAFDRDNVVHGRERTALAEEPPQDSGQTSPEGENGG